MSNWYLKKFVPVYTFGTQLHIGAGNIQMEHLVVENSTENNALLKKTATEGISDAELAAGLGEKMKDLNFLETESPTGLVNRNELFLNYFANLQWTQEIKEKKVLIFGGGAGGGTLTYLLAQFGFCNLTVVDFDEVSQSDLYRVMTHDAADIGSLKIDALNRRIRDNFGVEIHTDRTLSFEYEEIEKVIDRHMPEFIVMACDPDLKFRVNLNKYCFRHMVNYIVIAYSYEHVKVGPLYIPGFTACDADYNRMIRADTGEPVEFETYKRLFREHYIHPSVTFNINILANLALKEIIFFLSGQYEYCFSIGRLVEFNPIVLTHRHWEIVRYEDCKVCSHLK